MVQLIAAAALAAFQIASGYQQGEMIRESARLKKEVDDLNVNADEIDAFNARKEGYSDAARYESVINTTIGQQRTAMAAKNIDVNYGTAAELQDESKLNGYLNILDINRKAQNRAYGYENKAASESLSGTLAVHQAETDASSAEMRGLSNGLGTAISGYSRS